MNDEKIVITLEDLEQTARQESQNCVRVGGFGPSYSDPSYSGYAAPPQPPVVRIDVGSSHGGASGAAKLLAAIFGVFFFAAVAVLVAVMLLGNDGASKSSIIVSSDERLVLDSLAEATRRTPDAFPRRNDFATV